MADDDPGIERAREELRAALPAEPAKLTRLLAHVLDDAVRVPGTEIRVGLDPLLSLVPWGGTTVGALFGTVMMVDAVRLRTPLPVLARMGVNYLIDWAIGLVPYLGALGDVAWRANRRNLALVNRVIADREQVRRATVRYFLAAGAVVVGLVVLVVGGTVWLLTRLLGLLG